MRLRYEGLDPSRGLLPGLFFRSRFVTVSQPVGRTTAHVRGRPRNRSHDSRSAALESKKISREISEAPLAPAQLRLGIGGVARTGPAKMPPSLTAISRSDIPEAEFQPISARQSNLPNVYQRRVCLTNWEQVQILLTLPDHPQGMLKSKISKVLKMWDMSQSHFWH